MTFGGIGLVVIGLVLLALGHRGNTGLPIVAVVALSCAIGVVSSWFAAPEVFVEATLPALVADPFRPGGGPAVPRSLEKDIGPLRV